MNPLEVAPSVPQKECPHLKLTLYFAFLTFRRFPVLPSVALLPEPPPALSLLRPVLHSPAQTEAPYPDPFPRILPFFPAPRQKEPL
mgnify:CR=1 FL=1